MYHSSSRHRCAPVIVARLLRAVRLRTASTLPDRQQCRSVRFQEGGGHTLPAFTARQSVYFRLGAAAAQGWPSASPSPPPLLTLSKLSHILTSRPAWASPLLVPRRARSTSLRSRVCPAHHSLLFGGCSDLAIPFLSVPSDPRHAGLSPSGRLQGYGLRPNINK